MKNEFQNGVRGNSRNQSVPDKSNDRDGLPRKSQGFGLTWKVSIGLVALITLLGVLVVGLVYGLTRAALRQQLDRRALAISANLSDAAAGHAVRKNALALFGLVRQYALLEGVEYVFIEDARGEVIAHTLGDFPGELKVPNNDPRQAQTRAVRLNGKTVYQARSPILGGQVGAVHLGMKGDYVDGEIRRALLPIITAITGIFVSGIVLCFIFAWMMTRPIRRLSFMADRMSKGDLDTPVHIDSRDELGDVARSLERMRSSLKVAIASLQSRQP
jgi:HAMP domain-containing protein